MLTSILHKSRLHGRPRSLTVRIGLAATVGAVALTVAGQGGANAASAPGVPGPAKTGVARTTSSLAPVRLPGQTQAHTYTAQQQAEINREGGDPRVLAYWTPKRMRDAKSLNLPGDSAEVDAAVRRATAKLVAAAGPAKQGAAPAGPSIHPTGVSPHTPPVTNFSRTNGKLFIGGYGSTSWCSASSINTASRRVVITAGHCVHTGKGGTWQSNLVFVPGYNAYAADPTPVGTFQAYRLRTFNDWINYGGKTLNSATLPGFQRDVGFVTTYNGGDWNTTVGATVGGHGMTYNGSYAYDVSIFGYPSNRSAGNAMYACWGSTAADDWSYRERITGCNFGPGSSGGPWLYNYSNTTGLGNVRSVMSTFNSSTNVNAGPYFDTAVYNALQAANGDW